MVWSVRKIIVIVSCVQKSAWNLGEANAQGVETCPGSGGRFSEVGIICPESGVRLCTVGGNLPWIWGKIFRCRNCLPWIWGTFMHGGGKSVPNLRHVFPSSEWFPPDLGQKNELPKWFALNLGQYIARCAMLCPRFRTYFSDFSLVIPFFFVLLQMQCDVKTHEIINS